MTAVYVDSSVGLGLLLGDSPRLPVVQSAENLYTSALLQVEAMRSIDRLRVQGTLTEEEFSRLPNQLISFLGQLHVLGISDRVLRSAGGPMPTVVKTLDAIHLATAMLIRDRLEPELVFATHDRQQGLAAQALGLTVAGV